MKFLIQSPDARGKIDGTNKATLLDHLPLTTHPTDAAAVIVPISFFPDFRFNLNLHGIRQKVICIDYTEYGHDFWTPERRTHLFGDGKLPEYLQQNPEWAKLDAWLANTPPALTLKRELHGSDVSARVRPIEFLCTLPATPIQTREQFDARPYDVFNCFGYSHPSRPRLHGQIFEAMADRGVNVISDWSQFDNLPQPIPPHTWISMYSPWWCRQPLARVMGLQRQSKISISLPGAGMKSFRHAESPVDAVMAMQRDDLAWSHPWISGTNCIRLDPNDSVGDLISWTQHTPELLYDIYLASQETTEKYRVTNYVRDYVLPTIKSAL